MAKQSNNNQQLRIIAGQWRGRKLKFPALPGLRPTPDRIRETLFNWLAPIIQDSHCLDLFAGSGALGFEALSRGAAEVIMIDNDVSICQNLHTNATILGSQDKLGIFNLKIPQDFPRLKELLRHSQLGKTTFDIVFLDPPYRKTLLKTICLQLEQQQWLSSPAYIYIEAEKELTDLPIPENWRIIRSKVAGQVGYHLAIRESGNTQA